LVVIGILILLGWKLNIHTIFPLFFIRAREEEDRRKKKKQPGFHCHRTSIRAPPTLGLSAILGGGAGSGLDLPGLPAWGSFDPEKDPGL
jgi:hypothetical protein